jgi:hypothetical protein
VHRARSLAEVAVTTLSRRHPNLGLGGPWKRFVGIDDRFVTAPAVTVGSG